MANDVSQEAESASGKEPDRTEIEASLAKILRQPDFAASQRLSAFLTFIVTESLEGRADRLKAFTIAVAVFGRNDKFDPQTNPIVRVEAMRLRRLLDYYYAGPGAAATVEIRVPRGAYAPVFVSRQPAAIAAVADQMGPSDQTAQVSPPAADADTAIPRRFSKWRASHLGQAFFAHRAMLPFVAVLCVILAAETFFFVMPARLGVGSKVMHSTQTRIVVDPLVIPQADPVVAAFAEQFVRSVEDGLSRFDDPVVVHNSGGQVAGSENADYRLDGQVTKVTADNVSLSFRLVHPASREIIWSRTFDDVPTNQTAAAHVKTIEVLVTTVAQTYGVVFTDTVARLPAERQHIGGIDCVILTFNFYKTPSEAAHRSARSCLERTIAEDPTFAGGYSALAFLLLESYLDGIGARQNEVPLDLATQMAVRSVDLAPQKSRPQAANFAVRFFDKRFDDAFESGRTALERNPFSSDNAARVGAGYVLRGELDPGVPLLQSAMKLSYSPPNWYRFYLFLAAHLRGDEKEASRWVGAPTAAEFPLDTLARVIVSHENGEPDKVSLSIKRLFAEYPAFAANLQASFDRYAMAPAVSTRLLADLQAAGYPSTPR